MINLQFNLRNPWSNRWECIYNHADETPFKSKFWEVQIDRCADIAGFEFRFTTRQDHAGVYVSAALFGYDIIFNIYDNRHWNHEQGCWYGYIEDEING